MMANSSLFHEATLVHGAASRFHSGREIFRAARPFPHIVLDGLFVDELMDLVDEQFAEPTAAEVGGASACKDSATRRGAGETDHSEQ